MVVLVPLGYNPAATEQERQMRLHSLGSRTRLRMIVKLQAWWRAKFAAIRRAAHQRTICRLIVLNAKAVLIQRWWRWVAPKSRHHHAAAGGGGARWKGGGGVPHEQQVSNHHAHNATSPHHPGSGGHHGRKVPRLDADDASATAHRLINDLERRLRREALAGSLLDTWTAACGGDVLASPARGTAAASVGGRSGRCTKQRTRPMPSGVSLHRGGSNVSRGRRDGSQGDRQGVAIPSNSRR